MFATTSKYALRLMMCLARHPLEEGLVPSRVLAEEASVPRAYISKVLQRLEEAGLVVAKKGRTGGYRLAEAPQQIRLAAVLAAIDEPSVEPNECVFGWGRCNLESPCVLHNVWQDMRDEVATWSQQTLQDVLERSRAP